MKMKLFFLIIVLLGCKPKFDNKQDANNPAYWLNQYVYGNLSSSGSGTTTGSNGSGTGTGTTTGTTTTTGTGSVGLVTPSQVSFTSFSPTAGVISAPVILRGSNFSNILANNKVFFNGTEATVTAATSTTLSVTVPVGATSGNISVTVNNITVVSNVSFSVIVPIALTLNANYVSGTTLSIPPNAYYSFPVMAGKKYFVSWDDSFEGSSTYTGDIYLSAYLASNPTSYISFNIDSGYRDYSPITATATDTLILEISASPAGTFGIRATESLTYISQASGTVNSLHGISCLDANNCYIAGNIGTILKTTNGGMNWSSLTSGSVNDLNGISCIDAITCIVVGTSGTIRKTTNGSFWSAQTSPNTNNLLSIVCLNANTCFAVGSLGTIIKTVDGGSNWTAQTSGTTNSFSQITCLDINTCFTAGVAGTIRKTINGGSNWTTLTGTAVNIGGVACTSVNNCFFSIAGQAISTSNGGTTFNPFEFGERGFTKTKGNCISGSNTCIFANGGGKLVFTTSGTLWAPHATPLSTTQFNDALCTSSSLCFAVGNGGVIVKGQ